MGVGSTVAVGSLVSARLASVASPSDPSWAQAPLWFHVLADAGGPVAESSPTVVTLDGAGPSVVVGDRAGFVYGFHLSDGSPVPGWPVKAAGPVDSTPSVAASGAGVARAVLVGAGNAAHPAAGGYEAFGPAGNLLWHTSVTNPSGDRDPVSGVQASLSVGPLQGGSDAVAGSLGQEEYALNTTNGSTLQGWPFFTSDSDFSTAALADLYGTGGTEVVEGGDQTAGLALGQRYPQGGHLRVLNGTGGLICHYDTDQTVDSSPAVGGFLAGGATGVVVGTGSFFAGASDTNTVLAFGTDCNLQWSARLDGGTFSSPALADVTGNGTLDVVEGTDSGSDGSVWVLRGSDGQKLWSYQLGGRVIGSVVTADLSGDGYQDLLVPTTAGVEILDGRSGRLVASLNTAAGDINGVLGFQNSPLVTDDPDGMTGITVAGYDGADRGVIEHFEVPGSLGASVANPGGWPMFHHDPQMTGDASTTPPPVAGPACTIPEAAESGYHLVAGDGGVFSFGTEPFCGSTGGMVLNARIVAIAAAPSTGGYWLVASDGGVFAYGGAEFLGSMGGQRLNKPIVGLTATADGKGYWLVASDGGVFAFGDAPFAGSMGGQVLNKPIVGMTEDIATGGYWLVASDGGVFAFNAPFFGSTGGHRLNKPIVGMQAELNGSGYRFAAADGGVFTFGGAGFAGSTGSEKLNKPMVGMSGT